MPLAGSIMRPRCTLPATVNNSTPSKHSQGEDQDSTLATIICPSGAHDIWITQVQSQADVGPKRDVRTETGERDVDGPRNQGPERKFQRTKKGTPRRSKAQARPGDKLALEADKPIARLDFSEDGRLSRDSHPAPIPAAKRTGRRRDVHATICKDTHLDRDVLIKELQPEVKQRRILDEVAAATASARNT